MLTLRLLEDLIAHDTVSARPNIALMESLRDRLASAGAAVELIADASGGKANLYATIGPRDVPGVLVSGHTDVVPIEGQHWSVPPFAMTRREGKVYGRGAADMKGFIASALAAALHASTRTLKTPLHLAFSYDEEIGCVGVRSMIEMLAAAPFRPLLCIVGEPTELVVATGHKGKTGCRVTCTGRAGHSAMAPEALNAIHLACDLISELRAMQERLADEGQQDADYGVPYSTVHVGRIDGGVALNIVPDQCTFLFEIRNIAADDPSAMLDEINMAAARIVDDERQCVPEANIAIEVFNTYPGLDTPRDADIVSFVRSLTGINHTMKVAFGTEGGLFSNRLGIPTVVCGPGSMQQGHKPDEYVTEEQLGRCDTMLAGLVARLEIGI